MILPKAVVRHLFKAIGTFVLLISILPSTIAQKVLDDSTKLIYGPKTTKIFLEADLYKGQPSQQSVDTSLNGFHNYNYVYQKNTIFQNQGIVGTASQSVFKEPARTIGYSLGLTPYSQYVPNQENFRYFNTRSPYTSVYLVESGVGESIVKVDFAVNVDSNVNIGASYQKLISEKLIDQQRQRDRQIDSDLFTFFTSLRSKNDKYHFLGNVYIFSHNALENGGYGGKDSTTINWFQRTALPAQFRTGQSSSDYMPKSYEKRTNAHFYQEYDLTTTKKALIFHRFDFTDQYIGYRETNTSSIGTRVVPLTFYPNTFYDSITTDQTTRLFKVENTLGVKSQSKRHFLSAYYTDKRFNYHQLFQTYTNDSLRVNMRSSVVGAEFSLRLTDSLRFNAKAEFQPSFTSTGNKIKDYFTNHFDNLLFAGLRWRFLEVYFSHTRVSPTIFQTAVMSNHFQWAQTLNPTTTDELGAKAGYKLPWHAASLKVQAQNINDYIYFRQTDATPTQFGSSFQLLYVTGNVSFNWWKLGFNGLVRYSKSSLGETASPIRFPMIYANPQMYFQSFIFKKALKFQIGVDAHYRTGYYADKYMPAIQTFYLQNDIMLNNNWNINVFLTAQIKRIRIFVRLNNVAQSTTDWGKQESKAGSAFTNTPGYFGIPFSFVFGFNWTFFD